MNKYVSPIFFIAFILALCSITYELLLSQMLAAYLGNTVLRYSVTVGLYMLSMGIGSFAAEGRFQKKPLKTLLTIEVLLSVIGAGAILFLSFLSGFGISSPLFSAVAHSLILVIGFLTGAEIPLLMYIHQKEKDGEDNIVLGVDYVGALCGAILFALFFYPRAGLVSSAIFIGLLNACAGLLLLTKKKLLHENEKRKMNTLWFVQGIVAIVLIIAVVNVEALREYFIQQYLIG